ncbi:MAG: transposase [Armatimonadetes bacterium]|nr:transposase [Armatimonadota bacterium]
MSKRVRRHHTPEQKAALLRRHLVDKVAVSQICEENELQPSVLYDWLRQLLERAPAAFASPRTSSREHELEHKVAALEEKLARKDGVIAEISEEFVKLKKELGEP